VTIRRTAKDCGKNLPHLRRAKLPILVHTRLAKVVHSIALARPLHTSRIQHGMLVIPNEPLEQGIVVRIIHNRQILRLERRECQYIVVQTTRVPIKVYFRIIHPPEPGLVWCGRIYRNDASHAINLPPGRILYTVPRSQFERALQDLLLLPGRFVKVEHGRVGLRHGTELSVDFPDVAGASFVGYGEDFEDFGLAVVERVLGGEGVLSPAAV